jgi:putative N6-adenine-specific DNA methylase
MYKITLPVLMGLESVLGKELENLGFPAESIHKDNALVSLDIPQDRSSLTRAVALCNIGLRTAERVQLQIESFPAETFDELFDGVRQMDWSRWIPRGAAFVVKGYNRKSKLYANSAIQSTIKKGIVLSLQRAWGLNEDSTLEEDPSYLKLQVSYAILDDQVYLSIDTTGTGLHKRSYRLQAGLAPIKETLAYGILDLSRYNPFSGELLYDPCCGSGTFLIEAAMEMANIMPGTKRSFAGEEWPFLDKAIFDEVRARALAEEDPDSIGEVLLAGSDIDARNIKVARENAKRAGVEKLIDFSMRDLFELDSKRIRKTYPAEKILFVANPPYGERMAQPEDVRRINQALGRLAFYPDSGFTKPGTRLSVITMADFEEDTGRKADKRRKLYNGMLKTTLYQYFREKYVDKK